MEEGRREPRRVLPGSAPSDLQSTRSRWQWAGINLDPQPRPAMLPRPISAEEIAPLSPAAPELPGIASTGYW